MKNGHHYIRYDEMFEGFADHAQNLVKITDHVLEVRKKGVINVHMVFEENKKNIAYYTNTTPFGTMQMGIAATRVKVQEEQDHIGVRDRVRSGDQ